MQFAGLLDFKSCHVRLGEAEIVIIISYNQHLMPIKGLSEHGFRIKSYMQATPADMRASDEYVGSLITRLLTVDCPAPLKAAYAANPASLENAFGVVGEVAMQELMTNEDVNKTLTNYVHFTDTDKIDKLLK